MDKTASERHEKRILIVDDDDAIRALLFTVMRRRGFDVDTARNGLEALERCARCHYSLILLDLMMPQMSGWEFLERIRPAVLEHGRPLIIVLTAGGDPTGLDPAVVVGAVRKPFDIPTLVDMATGCLSTLASPRQLASCPGPQSRNARGGDEKPN